MLVFPDIDDHQCLIESRIEKLTNDIKKNELPSKSEVSSSLLQIELQILL